MEYQQILLNFLSGKENIKTIIELFKSDCDFRAFLDSLLPVDAINNPNHQLWENYSYTSMKQNGFMISEMINMICRFDDSLGDNLNFYSIIEYFSVFALKNVVCTQKYHDEFNLYLDVIHGIYDGPEVRKIVSDMIRNCNDFKSKSSRRANLKEQVADLFHVENFKKYPHWIQGEEWPMGENSPMKYIESRKDRDGECVLYYFIDVDTKQTRIIKQYY